MMHWPLCECGKVMDAQTQTHQYTEEHDELEHWQGCICGRKKNVEPHRFGEWVEARKPTRTESGLRTRRCSVCGFNEEEKIPAVNLPQTGDSTHPGQYALLLAFCGLTLTLCLSMITFQPTLLPELWAVLMGFALSGSFALSLVLPLPEVSGFSRASL